MNPFAILFRSIGNALPISTVFYREPLLIPVEPNRRGPCYLLMMLWMEWVAWIHYIFTYIFNNVGNFPSRCVTKMLRFFKLCKTDVFECVPFLPTNEPIALVHPFKRLFFIVQSVRTCTSKFVPIDVRAYFGGISIPSHEEIQKTQKLYWNTKHFYARVDCIAATFTWCIKRIRSGKY